MYEADDLTEETEEIVLKRQRNAVDFAKFNLEQTKQYCDEMLNVRLPRYDIDIKESLDKAALALARAKTALALDLNRARYELEQQKQTRAKSLDRHAKLLADRGADGDQGPGRRHRLLRRVRKRQLVRHGVADHQAQAAQLVSADTVLMTIVERRPLTVLAQVDEDKRPDFAVGQTAKIVPPARRHRAAPGEGEEHFAVPVATGKFDINFDLTGSELPDWIVAGMSCKVKVTTYDKDRCAGRSQESRPHRQGRRRAEVRLARRSGGCRRQARTPQRQARQDAAATTSKFSSGLKKGDVISLDDEEKKEDEDEAKEDRVSANAATEAHMACGHTDFGCAIALLVRRSRAVLAAAAARC